MRAKSALLNSKAILGILIFCLILGVVLVWLIGSYLTAPSPSTHGNPPESALEVTFRSESGSNVSGWLFENEAAPAAVLLLHGKNASRMAMLDRAKRFHSMGYTALAIDFQAHGESDGKRVTLGLLESLDVDASVALLEQRFVDTPIIGVGVSLGGAAMLLSDSTPKFELIVLESVYPDITTAVANRLNAIIPYSGLLSPLLTFQLKFRLGEPASWFSPINAAGDVQQPTLVMSGASDKRTTAEETRSIYDSLAGPKRIMLMDGIGHDDLELFARELYWVTVEEFISEFL